MKALAFATLSMTASVAAAAPDPDPAAPPPADPAAPVGPPAVDRETPRLAPPSMTRPVVIAPEGDPPLDGGRIAGEVLVGAGAGAVGLTLGALAGAGIECAHGCPGDFGGLGGAIIGGAIGGVIGIGVGVWAIGNAGDQTGSLGAAVGGAFLGAAAGGLLGAAMDSVDHHLDNAIGVVVVAGPFAGALIGFNLSRHWDRPSPPAVGSLLRYDRGTLHAGIPLVAPNANGTSMLSLASGSF